MGNFDDAKPKSAKEHLKEAVEFLDDCCFKFACFTGSFKRYLEEQGVLEDEDKT